MYTIPTLFSSKTLSKTFIISYIIIAIFATIVMSLIGIANAIDSAHIGSETINAALYEFNAVQTADPTKLIPYVVFPADSPYVWLYGIYCGGLIAGSYIAVIWFMMKILKQLNANQKFMSSRTVKLNKQINTIMLVQVSI